ncbi:sodium:phosphate symporter [Malaciobacter marinus]|uniref:Sodium:pantothenate symporter n=1 Tax=Malaciobacter marinus TaxID=505249 RepID=A0A347TKX6_9BACT|nr:Na/Pi symporter [Malaciobacter marinus]AXX87254.1 sodium:phosphate symporter [Malaciobacter marinus]PHO15512.1 sodium:pantothenate symporter [Malaciobacter marinus]
MVKNLAIALGFLITAYFISSSENLKIILSGIAIFLIGMYFMENGFKLFSGGALENILKRFTSNLFKAITTGFLATSIVQSSSLITVIVISFLSVELLTLAQGIGIVFGSNLGSTTTAWIVSSVGLKIKISAYAMPMLIFGVVLRFFKNNTYKGLGNVLLGLGFIFLGISYMKDGFDTLKDSIDLAQFSLPGIKGIILYILIGAVATIVIQSSSATMAIIITALSAGNIIYINALALAIGANIGTTVTAIIGSFASNENGKRLAFAHLIFNVITALVAVIFIYSLKDFVDYLAPLFGIGAESFSMKLALFHTIFNLLGIIIVAPFINIIVNLAKRIIKKKVAKSSKPKYLLKSNIEIPNSSLLSLKKECINLYENCQRAMLHALNLHSTKLKTKEDLQKQLMDEIRKSNTNIDEIYQTNLKLLYSEIIQYSSFAQEHMTSSQHKVASNFKKSATLIIEVLKDTRDVQKNLDFYLKSKNEYIKKEYNNLREELGNLFIDINGLNNENLSELDKITQIEVIKSTLNKNDLSNSETIDTLIRTQKIKASMATSLINDSATVYSIQKKLVEVAMILFIEDELLKEIGEENNASK